jgi:hypothetical protein
MASIRDQTLKNALVNWSGSILCLEGTKAHVEVSAEALRVWKAEVNKIIPQTQERIYEHKDSQAQPKDLSDFTKGLITVSGSAVQYALSEGRTTVSGSDIEKAVKSSFCHVWPFCK